MKPNLATRGSCLSFSLSRGGQDRGRNRTKRTRAIHFDRQNGKSSLVRIERTWLPSSLQHVEWVVSRGEYLPVAATVVHRRSM